MYFLIIILHLIKFYH